MTVDTMRRVDRFLGIPLCIVAGMCVRFLQRNERKAEPERWDTVVVMKMFGLGSILLTSPFLQELRNRHPEAYVVYVTFTENHEVLRWLPGVDEGILIRTSSPWMFILDTVRAIKALRGLHPDVLFDLEFFSKYTTLLATLSGTPHRRAFRLPTRWRRWNATVGIPLRQDHHITRSFLEQLPWHIDGDEARHLNIPAPSESIRIALLTRLLSSADQHRPMVIININAGAPSHERRWPRDRFARIAVRYLRVHPDTIIFFSGSKSERPYVQQLLDENPGLETSGRNIAGQLTLEEFSVLLSGSRWLLSNDSGPIHIAAALGTPVVALFGPETPARYAPLQGAHVVYAGLSCSPCLNVYTAKITRCPYRARCMREISVDEVFRALMGVEHVPLAG